MENRTEAAAAVAVTHWDERKFQRQTTISPHSFRARRKEIGRNEGKHFWNIKVSKRSSNDNPTAIIATNPKKNTISHIKMLLKLVDCPVLAPIIILWSEGEGRSLTNNYCKYYCIAEDVVFLHHSLSLSLDCFVLFCFILWFCFIRFATIPRIWNVMEDVSVLVCWCLSYFCCCCSVCRVYFSLSVVASPSSSLLFSLHCTTVILSYCHIIMYFIHILSMQCIHTHTCMHACDSHCLAILFKSKYPHTYCLECERSWMKMIIKRIVFKEREKKEKKCAFTLLADLADVYSARSFPFST